MTFEFIAVVDTSRRTRERTSRYEAKQFNASMVWYLGSGAFDLTSVCLETVAWSQDMRDTRYQVYINMLLSAVSGSISLSVCYSH